MKIEDTPQDNGMIGDHGHEICYAVDKDGRYTLSPSLGWEVKNIVNDQAWVLIIEETRKAHEQVQQGKRSPLAYHQAKNQMDNSLLAHYMDMARWRVRRHLKPAVFRKLSQKVLQKYADVFDISLDELKTVPKIFSAEFIQNRS